MPHHTIIFIFVYLIFMSEIVLYFLHSTVILHRHSLDTFYLNRISTNFATTHLSITGDFYVAKFEVLH